MAFRVMGFFPGIICTLIVVLQFSCSGNGQVEKGEKEPDSNGRIVIRIEFDLPGDDIGSPEHVAVLNRLKASIQKSSAGEIVSSGFGMGNMEIVLSIEGAGSINTIKKIIIDNYPEARYRIVKRTTDWR